MEPSRSLAELKPYEYVALAKDLLNLELNLQLEEPENSINGPDLWQKKTNDELKVIVEVKSSRLNPSSILRNIDKKIIEEIARYNPEQYILINFGNVTPQAIATLAAINLKLSEPVFTYLGIDWIIEKLDKYPDIKNKHNIRLSDFEDKSEATQSDTEFEQFRIDINLFSNRYSKIAQSSDFYFQEAIDLLAKLKEYDEPYSLKRKGDFIAAKRSKDSNATPFEQLDFHWRNRDNVKPSEFSAYLESQQEELVPLYNLIIKFIAYIDKNSFDKQNLNDYEDKRSIAKTGLNPSQLVEQFLKLALSNFELLPESNTNIFNRAIRYLESPESRFNILSEKHRNAISEFFLGKIYKGPDFHQYLKLYFDRYGFSIKNSSNVTYFYTVIIYDTSVRSLWDKPEKISSNGGRGSEPPIDTNFDDDFPNEDPSENNDHTRDKIPFHLDQVVEIDKLGREPVAKAFVNLIKNDVFTDKLTHSFMVHLQGEWGAGKSSFLNFISKNLSTDGEKWIVVNYNAWQNQHITPPWWTLIDQIYQQSKRELKGWDKFKLWIKENRRRIIWYSGWQKIMSFLITIALTLLLIAYGSSIFDILTKSSFTSTQVDNLSKGLTIEVFAKLLVSLSALIGVVYSFSKFISTPLFMKTSKEAESFMCRASDPMRRIKNHFSYLVNNINSKEKKRQLAIFIDDIDRCNKEYIVQLLEGIQTLFKDKRVLYIVAGDKKWITTSFGNAYKEFSIEPNKSHELGELFLEKAFQLSFRMPNVSESAKRDYWNYILGIQDNGVNTKIDSFMEFSIELQNIVTNSIKNALVDITSPKFMKEMEVKYNLTEDLVTDLIIEEKNSNKQEIQHLLKGFHSVIDANPRSIIRLANNYTMIRSTLIAERKDVSAEKIFRWLVIEDLFPKIKLEIGSVKTIDDIIASFERAKLEEKLLADLKGLLLDEEAIWGDSFEMEEINDIIGL